MTTVTEACAKAMAFARDEAGFAQVVTLDKEGFPVGRSMTAFLNDDWTVDLIQRGQHARIHQLRSNPRILVVWVGSPAEAATNEHPHVFDVGTLPPRAVFIRGVAEFMDAAWTQESYFRLIQAQRDQGLIRAPLRDAAQVEQDLLGLRVHPRRIRLEGFGTEAQSFDWSIGEKEDT